MSTSTETTTGTQTNAGNWLAGALGGAAGAIAMGALIVATNEPTIAVAIPSLYTLAPPPSFPLGMAVHVFHGVVLGLVIAGLASAFDLESTAEIVGSGIVWGIATWLVFAVLLMPLWLGAVGSPANPPFPNFALPSLGWHVVYGLVLGLGDLAVESVR